MKRGRRSTTSISGDVAECNPQICGSGAVKETTLLPMTESQGELIAVPNQGGYQLHLVDDPIEPAVPHPNPVLVRALDKVLGVQRPIVLAHIRSIRLRNPHATPAQLIKILERRYLLAVTGGGAAVGASAVIPVVSTPVALTLAGVETVGFLESTGLFAQSVAEVHGIPVEDPDRARILIMTLMLGKEAGDLLGQFTRQVTGRGGSRSVFWGEIVTSALPRGSVGFVLDRLQAAFLRKFAKFGAGSIVGKALPFGIGAAVGGTGNLLLGRKVVTSSQHAFGPAPYAFPDTLEPREGAEPIELRAFKGLRAAGAGVASGIAKGVTAGGKGIATGANRVAAGAKKGTKAITRSE